jgi:hypothetical protein
MSDPDMDTVYSDFYFFWNTHYKYLEEIAQLVSLGATQKTWAPISVINGALSTKLSMNDKWSRSRKNKGLPDIAIRHLQNSWFNECALRYPYDGNFLERMRFAPWKIVQFYYVIYSGLSSMLRFIDSTAERTHIGSLNFFLSGIASDSRLCTRLFPIPIGFFLMEDKLLPDRYHVKIPVQPRYYRGELGLILSDTRAALKMKADSVVGMVHYFRWLREWFNYYAAYIFANLYGTTVKSNLDHDLAVISSSFMMATEMFAISFLGKRRFRALYGNFRRMLIGSLNVTPTFIDERLALY